MSSSAVSADAMDAAQARLGVLCGVAGAFLFSTKPIFIKLAYQQGLQAESVMLLRLLMSLPFYLVIGALAWRQHDNRAALRSVRVWALALLTGWLGYYLASILDLWALESITAQTERMMLFTYPAVVALLSWLLFRQRITRHEVLAMALCYSGVLLLFALSPREGGDSLAGMLLMVLCTLSFASYVVLSKQSIGVFGARLFTCVAMSAAALGILLHWLVYGQWQQLAQVTPTGYALVAGIALFATVIPSFLISAAIARIGAQRTSITGMSGLLMTSLLAVTLLGEVLTLRLVLAMVLIAGGVYVLLRKPNVA